MYTPIPAIRRSRIEPGEDITIDVFLSGYGNITSNKLIIVPSSDELVDVDIGVGEVDWEERYSHETVEDDKRSSSEAPNIEEAMKVEGDIGKIACLYFPRVVSKNDQGVEEPVGIIGKLYKRDFYGSSVTISIPSGIFSPSGASSNPTQMQSLLSESQYYLPDDINDLPEDAEIDDNHSNAEENPIAPEGHPPVRLSFPTNENLSPGNYQVHFIFTYSDGIIRQSSRSADIHVETWAERNNKALRAGALILSLIIALSALIPLGTALNSLL